MPRPGLVLMHPATLEIPMSSHAYRLLLMAGALAAGPLLTAQSLPNPLHLPDPLGITDSKDGHKDQSQPQERHRGHRRHDDRRMHRHDARREDRRGDHREGRHDEDEGHRGR